MIPQGTTMTHIKAILKDLETYMDSKLILFERYHVPFEDLEARPDIRFARIAIYEMTDDVTDKINDHRANLSLVQFGVDISVIRAYSKDNDTRGEEPLLNIRDNIVQWSKSVDAPTLTDLFILALGYTNSANIIRNDKFVSRTMTFDAVKDLHLDQVTVQ